MKKLEVNQEHMYILFENDEGELILRVTCGGIGMFNVAFKLSESEVKEFRDKGTELLISLSRTVNKENDSEDWQKRFIKI